MNKKKRTRSLRIRIWGYFILYTAVIMTALWLLQIVLLNSFYTQMKMNELQKAAETIASDYETGNVTDQAAGQLYGPGITLRIYDSDGNPLFSQIGPGGKQHGDQPDPSILTKLMETPAGRVSVIISEPHLAGKTLNYGLTLSQNTSGGKYLVVSAQINLADSPAALLQTQLIIVIVVALLLSVGISLLIASRLSRPITKITKTAAKLAEGNYDIQFETGGYTEIDQLASTLNYATTELSKTNKLQRELIANVSHDLRTPLTMVKMYAELIRDVSGNREEKRNAHTQVIIEEADRLNALIADILDLSKLQSGTSRMSRTEFDLGDKTRVILNRFKALSELGGYNFTLDRSKETTVFADEQKIEQVIYNLISNAVNYTGEDKTIRISVTGREGKVRFEVQDTGPGIPAEELECIWERYYQSDKSHKRDVIGTGLGLSIVKGILETHSAAYGVNSTLGAGSTFWFEL